MTAAKRIILFIDSLTSGGAQRQMVSLAVLLKKKGYQVRVVAYYDIPFFREVLQKEHIECILLRNKGFKLFRIARFRRVLKKLKPELVLSYLTTPNIIAILAGITGRRWRLIISDRNTTQVMDLRTRITFFIYRFADQIVVNSSSQFHYMKSSCPSLGLKLVLITNSVDLDKFKPEMKKTGMNGTIEIAVVGRLQAQKNALMLARAVKEVISGGFPVRIHWYGNNFLSNGVPTAASEYYLKLLEEIGNLGIETHFLLHDPVQDIRAVYAGADAVCLPSIYEGFSNVLAEAIACAKPVLASDVGDNGIMVKDQFNGFLFNPSDLSSMVRSIEALCRLNTDELGRFGVRSRQLALQLFSEEKFVNQYIEVFQDS